MTNDPLPNNARRSPRRYLLWGMVAVNAVVIALLVYVVVRLVAAPETPPMHSGHGDIGGDEAGATVYDPPHAVHDFTLTRHTGEPFRLSDLRGRMALLFFGFTHCPDVCPNTMATFVRVKEALGERAEAVAFVFISVDGARDTPEVLAAYLDQFDPGFIGLTGDEADLRRIGEDYDLYFARRASSGSGDDYMVDHTASSFLLDQEGRLVMEFPYGTRAEDIAEAIAAQ